mmetsp:Transcript_2943/g.7063  ORF Transcript_2943/g.7063 Transcript_2943/m.7063 type:complete len:566 (+) Transcript_2943:3-1700(+)
MITYCYCSMVIFYPAQFFWFVCPARCTYFRLQCTVLLIASLRYHHTPARVSITYYCVRLRRTKQYHTTRRLHDEQHTSIIVLRTSNTFRCPADYFCTSFCLCCRIGPLSPHSTTAANNTKKLLTNYIIILSNLLPLHNRKELTAPPLSSFLLLQPPQQAPFHKHKHKNKHKQHIIIIIIDHGLPRIRFQQHGIGDCQIGTDRCPIETRRVRDLREKVLQEEVSQDDSHRRRGRQGSQRSLPQLQPIAPAKEQELQQRQRQRQQQRQQPQLWSQQQPQQRQEPEQKQGSHVPRQHSQQLQQQLHQQQRLAPKIQESPARQCGRHRCRHCGCGLQTGHAARRRVLFLPPGRESFFEFEPSPPAGPRPSARLHVGLYPPKAHVVKPRPSRNNASDKLSLSPPAPAPAPAPSGGNGKPHQQGSKKHRLRDLLQRFEFQFQFQRCDHPFSPREPRWAFHRLVFGGLGWFHLQHQHPHQHPHQHQRQRQRQHQQHYHSPERLLSSPTLARGQPQLVRIEAFVFECQFPFQFEPLDDVVVQSCIARGAGTSGSHTHGGGAGARPDGHQQRPG